jgi:hypothetical protein
VGYKKVKIGRWKTQRSKGDTWNQSVTLSTMKNPGDELEVIFTPYKVADNLTIIDENGQSTSTGLISGEDEKIPVPSNYEGKINATVSPNPNPDNKKGTKFKFELRKRSRTTVTTKWKFWWGFLPIGLSIKDEPFKEGDKDQKLPKKVK